LFLGASCQNRRIGSLFETSQPCQLQPRLRTRSRSASFATLANSESRNEHLVWNLQKRCYSSTTSGSGSGSSEDGGNGKDGKGENEGKTSDLQRSDGEKEAAKNESSKKNTSSKKDETTVTASSDDTKSESAKDRGREKPPDSSGIKKKSKGNGLDALNCPKCGEVCNNVEFFVCKLSKIKMLCSIPSVQILLFFQPRQDL